MAVLFSCLVLFACSSQSVMAQGTLAAPASFEAERFGGKGVTLTWDAVDPATGATGYEYTKDNGTSWTAVADSTQTTDEVVVDDLTPGTRYQFSVRAVDSNGGGTAATAVPVIIYNLDVTTNYDSVRLSWTQPTGVTGINKYQYTKDDGTTWTDIPSSSSTTTTFVIDSLSYKERYYIGIRALDSSSSTISGSVSEIRTILSNVFLTGFTSGTNGFYLPPDVDIDDRDGRFGETVAVTSDGTMMAVTFPPYQPLGDDPSDTFGAVYIANKNSDGAWRYDDIITTGTYGLTLGNEDEFGTFVAFSGDDTLYVSAKKHGDASHGQGVIHMFTKADDGNGFVRAGTIEPGTNGLPGSSNFIPNTMAFSPDDLTLAVSSGLAEVHLFTRPTTTDSWVWQEMITDGTHGLAFVDEGEKLRDIAFGDALVFSPDGETLFIGAEYDDTDSDLPFIEGAVHIFAKRGSTWKFRETITANTHGFTHRNESYFGSALAISEDGTILYVGAQSAAGVRCACDVVGGVYMFAKRDGKTWSYIGAYEDSSDYPASTVWGGLVLDFYFGFTFFGSSIVLDGNRMYVGAGFFITPDRWNGAVFEFRDLPDPLRVSEKVSDHVVRSGESISLTLPEAKGGAGSITYAVSGLPSELSFSPSTRVISGSPADGISTATYTITDSSASPQTVSIEFSIGAGTGVVTLKSSSDTGISDSDGITSDNTPVFTTSGFDLSLPLTPGAVITPSKVNVTHAILSWSTPSPLPGGVVRYQYSKDGGTNWLPIYGSNLDTTTHIVSEAGSIAADQFKVRAVGSTTGTAFNPTVVQSEEYASLTWTKPGSFPAGRVFYEYSSDSGSSWKAVGGSHQDTIKFIIPDSSVSSLAASSFRVRPVGVSENSAVCEVPNPYDVILTWTKPASLPSGTVTYQYSTDGGTTWDAIPYSDGETIKYVVPGGSLIEADDFRVRPVGNSDGSAITPTVSEWEYDRWEPTDECMLSVITVTAYRDGEDDVRAFRTGRNGDVTLPTLADGEWNVFAAHGADISPIVSITIDTAPPTITPVTLASHLDDGVLSFADSSETQHIASLATITNGESNSLEYAIIPSGDDCGMATDYTEGGSDISQRIEALDSGEYKVCARGHDAAGNAARSSASAVAVTWEPLSAGRTRFISYEYSIDNGRNWHWVPVHNRWTSMHIIPQLVPDTADLSLIKAQVRYYDHPRRRYRTFHIPNAGVLVKEPFSESSSFVKNAAKPSLVEVIPIPSTTIDVTPDWTFRSTAAGTITYSGGCTSTTTEATVGNNQISFGPLSFGAYTSCSITVTDENDNVSDPLSVSPFTVVDPATQISDTSFSAVYNSVDVSWEAVSSPSMEIWYTGDSSEGRRRFAAEMSWSGVSGESNVVYEYTINGGLTWHTFGHATDWQIEDLVDNMPYVFMLRASYGRVSAARAAGEGDFQRTRVVVSTPIVFRPDATSIPDSNRVAVQAPAIIGYDYTTDGTTWHEVPGSDGTTNSHTITSISSTAGASIGIRGRYELDSAVVSGPYSVADLIAGPHGIDGTTAYRTIVNPKVSPVYDSLLLQWTPPTSTTGITGYDYSIDGGTTWVAVPSATAATSSYTVTGLSEQTHYTVLLRVQRSTGPGDPIEIGRGMLFGHSVDFGFKSIDRGIRWWRVSNNGGTSWSRWNRVFYSGLDDIHNPHSVRFHRSYLPSTYDENMPIEDYLVQGIGSGDEVVYTAVPIGGSVPRWSWWWRLDLPRDPVYAAAHLSWDLPAADRDLTYEYRFVGNEEWHMIPEDAVSEGSYTAIDLTSEELLLAGDKIRDQYSSLTIDSGQTHSFVMRVTERFDEITPTVSETLQNGKVRLTWTKPTVPFDYYEYRALYNEQCQCRPWKRISGSNNETVAWIHSRVTQIRPVRVDHSFDSASDSPSIPGIINQFGVYVTQEYDSVTLSWGEVRDSADSFMYSIDGGATFHKVPGVATSEERRNYGDAIRPSKQGAVLSWTKPSSFPEGRIIYQWSRDSGNTWVDTGEGIATTSLYLPGQETRNVAHMRVRPVGIVSVLDPSAARSHRVEGLTPGEEYTFSVMSLDHGAEITPSMEVGGNNAVLTWSDPSSFPEGRVIYQYSTDAGGSWDLADGTTLGTNRYVVSGAGSVAAANFRVRPVGVVQYVNRTVHLFGLQASAGEDTVVLRWSNPADGATEYQYHKDGEDAVSIPGINPSSVVVSDVESGGVHLFQITARSSDGQVFVSNIVPAVSNTVLGGVETSVTDYPDGVHGFGFSMSSSGAVLAVGEPARVYDGTSGVGAVHLFRKANDVWQYETTVRGSDYGIAEFTEPVRFGSSVALSGDGNTLFVGAPWYDTASHADAGSVHMFLRGINSKQWGYIGRIYAETESAGALFGSSLALSSDNSMLFVGSPEVGSGTVDIYRLVDDTWTFVRSIVGSAVDTAIDGSALFGQSLALSADSSTLFVGAPGFGSVSGQVYVLNNYGSWNADDIEVSDVITVGDYVTFPWEGSSVNDRFGSAIAISPDGQMLFVSNPQSVFSYVRLFTKSNGQWHSEADSYLELSNTQYAGKSLYFADQDTLYVGADQTGLASFSSSNVGSISLITLSSLVDSGELPTPLLRFTGDAPLDTQKYRIGQPIPPLVLPEAEVVLGDDAAVSYSLLSLDGLSVADLPTGLDFDSATRTISGSSDQYKEPVDMLYKAAADDMSISEEVSLWMTIGERPFDSAIGTLVFVKDTAISPAIDLPVPVALDVSVLRQPTYSLSGTGSATNGLPTGMTFTAPAATNFFFPPNTPGFPHVAQLGGTPTVSGEFTMTFTGVVTHSLGEEFAPTTTSTQTFRILVLDSSGSVEGLRIEGGVKKGSVHHTGSGTKNVLGAAPAGSKVLIKIAAASDNIATYTEANRQDTSFADLVFDVSTTGLFSQSLDIASGDDGHKLVAWLWTDKSDDATVTAARSFGTLSVDDTPAVVSQVSVSTDNTSGSFARFGDTLTASFTTDDGIDEMSVRIANVPADCAIGNTGSTATCTAIMDKYAEEGSVTVAYTITDLVGNVVEGSVVSDDVVVDLTAPVVTVESDSTFVEQGDTVSFTLRVADAHSLTSGNYAVTATGGVLDGTCSLAIGVDVTDAETTCSLEVTETAAVNAVLVSIRDSITDAAGNTADLLFLPVVRTGAVMTMSGVIYDASKPGLFSLAANVRYYTAVLPDSAEIVFGGDCAALLSSVPSVSVDGRRSFAVEITDASARLGTYSGCTVKVRDNLGNETDAFTLDEFTIADAVEEETPPVIIPTDFAVDLVASSDTGISSTDNVTGDTTPTVLVSGFDPTDLITITAAQTGQSNVTATRTGNGEVALSSLAEGRWNIIASGGGDTTSLLTVTIDTSVPTLTAITHQDDSKSKRFSFTVEAAHNQHTNNMRFPETILPVFSGDCEKFEAEEGWTAQVPDGTTQTYTTSVRASKGTYDDCRVQLTDKAGNLSAQTLTFESFSVKSGGGGVSRIVGGRSPSGHLADFFLSPDAGGGSTEEEPSEQTPPQDPPAQQSYNFTIDLSVGSTGEDVRQLQIFLNTNGYIIAESGAGSPGQETTYFGELTRQALAQYQQTYGITPAAGYFGPVTRAHVNGVQGFGSTSGSASDGAPVFTTTDTEEPPEQTPPQDPPAQQSYNFTIDLSVGSTGEDVRQLQIFLNTNGYIIAESGAGSPGQETTYFGELTRQALAQYQQTYGITPAAGYFGPVTRAHVNGVQGFGSTSGSASDGAPVFTTTDTEEPPEQTPPRTDPDPDPDPEPQVTEYRLGDTHPIVRDVQRALNQTVCAVAITGPGSSGQETAYLDAATVNAVECYQSVHGLAVTGTINTALLNHLGL